MRHEPVNESNGHGPAARPRSRGRPCATTSRDERRRAGSRAPRPAAAVADAGGARPGATLDEVPDAPDRRSRSTVPPSRATSWTTSSRRSSAATRPRPARSSKRGRGDPAGRSGAEEVLLTTSCTAALELTALHARPPARRHGDRAVVHVHHDARSPSRGRARKMMFCDIEPRDPRPRPGAPRRRCSTTRCGRSCRSTTPASPATSTGVRKALADRPDVAVIEDNAHGLFGALARPAARQLRPLRHPELPRDQEHHLRRGRRAASSTTRPTSTGPASSTTRAPTGARSSSARSTSTPGRTPGRRSGSPTCWRRTCSPSSSRREPSRPSAATVFERYAARAGAARRRARASGCRSCPRTASRPTTCSTC